MFCSNCGTKVDESQNFCPNCGAKINQDIATAQPVAGEVENVSAEEAPSPVDSNPSSIAENNEVTEDNAAAEEKEEKPLNTILYLILAFCVFAWNSYVIVNNLSIGDGYGHAIAAIVINLGILCYAPIALYNLANKFKLPGAGTYALIGIGVLVITFVIAGPVIGRSSITGSYEDQACELVSQILRDNLGSNAAECQAVKFTSHPTDSYWNGEAYLDNANSLKIGFTRKGDSIYVNIKDFW